MDYFSIIDKDPSSLARTGVMRTAHGDVHTPAFLPIGTKGSVKGITTEELKFWGAEIVLANTYHVWMRPGDTLIRSHGGIHKFMGWDGPIFTDSGGFQVFSLGERMVKKNEGKDEEFGDHGQVLGISERGVSFRSDIDGQLHQLTPETSVQIQSNLGSDIALVLDYFTGSPDDHEEMDKAVELTEKWGERSWKQFEKISDSGTNPGQKLWGIVQGGTFPELRQKSAEFVSKLKFPGVAIGGVAVGGETSEMMIKAVDQSIPYLGEDRPRHLLGVGTPEQIVRAVSRGCDTFDCVLPTRNARHALLYVNNKAGQEGEYGTMRIRNEEYKEDFTPVDNTCSCYLCQKHTRAYLRHLFVSGEPLAIRLASMHNLRFYLQLMEKIRRSVKYGSFADMVESYSN